jgi:hypothetical protein
MLCHEPGVGPQESTFNEKHFRCAPTRNLVQDRPTSEPWINAAEAM